VVSPSLSSERQTFLFLCGSNFSEGESEWSLRNHRVRPSGIRIRFARSKEAATISSLYFEWLNFGDRRGRLQQVKRAIRAKEIIISLESKVERPIGFIQGIIQNDPISSGPIVYISSFYLQKQFRHKGIGSAMLRFLLRGALRRGAVSAEVATAQLPAFKLYRKFGFTQYHSDIGEVLLGLNFKELRHASQYTVTNTKIKTKNLH
jgi:ribosomal protein S18 acetylase RimI-like enzyme